VLIVQYGQDTEPTVLGVLEKGYTEPLIEIIMTIITKLKHNPEKTNIQINVIYVHRYEYDILVKGPILYQENPAPPIVVWAQEENVSKLVHMLAQKRFHINHHSSTVLLAVLH